jgi:acyl carrier protein
LPVRVDIHDDDMLPAWLAGLQQRQFQLAQNQYTSLEQIQRWSNVPWRYRIFDNLVVFQNYQIDPHAMRIGDDAQLTLLSAPEATNYPLTLTVALAGQLRIRALYQAALLSAADAREFVADLVTVLETMAAQPAAPLEAIRARLSPASRGKAVTLTEENSSRSILPFVAPASDLEQTIAAVWKELFGVDRLSLDDNFFDLGGHSILLVRAHAQLRQRLTVELPVVTLLQYPTIRSLARHLSGAAPTSQSVDTAMDRARRQREAQARQRTLARRP